MEKIAFEIMGAPVTGYLQDDHERLKAHKIRPALIICPGGGYGHLSRREMDPPALVFSAMGYQVFILHYGVEEEAGGYKPLRQLAETVKTIRDNAALWHIEPSRIAVMGFSAGGHLAASLCALWNDPEFGFAKETRPDAAILCYPLISTKKFMHEESVRWISGNDSQVREKLNVAEHVNESFPPAFIWHGGKDESVLLENSLLLAMTLRSHKVPFELHIFQGGVHGLSTCSRETETPDEACRAWVKLCAKWLNDRFAYEP